MGIKMIDKALENPRFLLVLIVFLLTLLIIQFFRNQCDKKKLRKDAVKRSKAVINGQVAEQIAPFLPDFPANPSDARFIGKPVDFIVFSGLSENEKIDEILFVEVKTGKSLLSEREKEVKKAIDELEKISLSPEERQRYEDREWAIMRYNSEVRANYEHGHKAGEEIGEKKRISKR